MPEEDKKDHKKEVAALLVLFRKFIQSIEDKEGEWESLEDLMTERAQWILKRAMKGFGLSYEDAIELLKKETELTDDEISKKNILEPAFDNLVDFAVASQYQMAEDVEEVIEANGFEDDDSLTDEDSEGWGLLHSIFSKYDDRYARVENGDAEYAMIVAAALSAYRSQDVLVYMTMGDERVRPWHRQFEGYTAPKALFPAWLVPPIEHQCRCFLIEETLSDVEGIMAQKVPEMPDWFNRTFKESVALGGRIFSDEHPYFTVDELHVGRLNEISKRIKEKLLT